MAALLNITPDHGDRQTWEEYVAAKWRIFENQTGEDASVVSEDMSSYPQYGSLKGWRWEFGDVCSDEFMVYCGDTSIVVEFTRNAPVQEYVLCEIAEVKLPGEHNRDNIMAAAAMASAFGVGIEPIRQAATTFTGVVHRLEYVETIDGVRYVNNSMCTNAAAFEKSLEALPEPKVVIAGGVFKGGDVATLADAVVKNNVKALVLMGRSAPEIEEAARAAGYEAVYRAGTLIEAVTTAAGLAEAGDTVLLAPACASFDMFADFEDRGEQFKAAVRALSTE